MSPLKAQMTIRSKNLGGHGPLLLRVCLQTKERTWVNCKLSTAWHQNSESGSSGVLKERRARHASLASSPPPFWGPHLRRYACKFSLFQTKNLLFQSYNAPPSKFHVSILLAKGPPTAIIICKYLAFKGAPNSNFNV